MEIGESNVRGSFPMLLKLVSTVVPVYLVLVILGTTAQGGSVTNFKNSTRVRFVKTMLVLSQSNMPIGDLESLV